MSRLTLTLETRLSAALREAAKKDDRSMSSVARKALAEYFGLGNAPANSKKKGGVK